MIFDETKVDLTAEMALLIFTKKRILQTGRRFVWHAGGDGAAVPDIQRDQRVGEGEGAADQGGPEDDGPHGRGAYRLVDIPLRVHILLHFRPHGAGFGVRL